MVIFKILYYCNKNCSNIEKFSNLDKGDKRIRNRNKCFMKIYEYKYEDGRLGSERNVMVKGRRNRYVI